MKLVFIPILFALYSSLAILCSHALRAPSDKPNIIFILSDDLGFGDVELYWNNSTHGRISTPNINKLALEGTRWENVYAGDTVCAPSRCTLMTGLDSGHSAIRGNAPVPLGANDLSFTTLLKKVGYYTGLIGKWGLGDTNTTGAPNKHGLDYFFGYTSQLLAHDYYPTSLWENTELYPIPENEDAPVIYSHDLFTNFSLNFVQQNYKRPFFLEIAYTIPHAGSTNSTDETGCPVPSEGIYANQTTWPKVERDFAAMITRMDNDIGKLMSLLKDLGIDNNTIVMFSSDNGAMNEGTHNYEFFDSSGPLNGFKRSMYDGGIRTPFIARWPGVVPVRLDTKSVWGFVDLFPTFTEIAGIPSSSLPDNLNGKSVLGNILGTEEVTVEPFLYWEFCCHLDFRRAVRMGDWKAVRWTLNGQTYLYNITSDIGEQNDLSEKYPEVVTQIEDIMKKNHVENPNFPSDPCNEEYC